MNTLKFNFYAWRVRRAFENIYKNIAVAEKYFRKMRYNAKLKTNLDVKVDTSNQDEYND